MKNNFYQEMLNLTPEQTNQFQMNNYLELFPHLEVLKTTPQDKIFHAEGDVWIHTEMVCNELINLPEYQNADKQNKFVMFYSALLHDISKPACTKIEDSGKITSAGHSKRGEIDVRIDLWKKEVPFDVRESICSIIAAHQVPFFVFNQKPNLSGKTRSPEFMAISLSWELSLNCLIPVAKADMRGRTYFDKQKCLDDIELFEILTKELGCYEKPFDFVSNNAKIKYFESMGDTDPNSDFFKNTKSNVIVLSGLPASGKDSYIALNHPDMPVISFDDARKKFNIKHGQNEGQAIHWAIDQAKEHLRKSEPFIWNATHISSEMRQKTLSLLLDYDANINLVYLEQPFDTLMSRNSARDSTLKNKTIEQMLFKWSVPSKKEAHNVDYLINLKNGLNKRIKP